MSDEVLYFNGPGMQSGAGAPAADLGMDNDRYLDTSSGDFYQKINGVWVKQANFGGLRLQLLGTATLGETTLISLQLGVKRYTMTATGAATGDRLLVALTGAPANGTVQDAYVSAANTANIGVLVPALGIGATIAVPVAVYKVI